MSSQQRLALHLGAAAIFLVITVVLLNGRSSRSGTLPDPKRHPRPAELPETLKPAAEAPASASSSRPRAPSVKPWPPKEVVLSQGGTAVGTAKAATPPQAPEAPKAQPVEAPGPTAEEIKELTAWKAKDVDTPEKAKEILLDPARSSAMKLIAIEKLKVVPAETLVPLLVDFLEADAPSGGAYTKPSAVKVLTTMSHPLADDALARLYACSTDDRVRLSIASFKGWPNPVPRTPESPIR